jgi:hypothetical protein
VACSVEPAPADKEPLKEPVETETLAQSSEEPGNEMKAAGGASSQLEASDASLPVALDWSSLIPKSES